MAKRVSKAANAAKPSRQVIWETLRALHADGQTFTTRDVWAVMVEAMPRSRVDDYLRSLVAAGYLQCQNPSRPQFEAARYALVRDVGVEAPRVRRDGSEPGTPGREQMWRTLRIIGDCSAAELADAASTPDSPIAKTTAREYCQFLRAAGYLQVTRPSKPGTPERFRLVASRWSGPMAPMIQRTKQLFDPNTGEVVYSRVTKTEGGEP